MSEFSFCEPVGARATTREHIREVPGDQLKIGGGIQGRALCGFDLDGGWDIPTGVDEWRVRRGLNAETNPTCPDCAAIWFDRVDASSAQPDEDGGAE